MHNILFKKCLRRGVKIFLPLLLVFVLLLSACDQQRREDSEGSMPRLAYSQLNVPLYGQQTGMWCWAASTQMILGYYGITVKQCALADSLLRKTYPKISCCDSSLGKPGCPLPNDPKCVHGGNFMVDKYGFTSEESHVPLSWLALTKQIDSLQSPMGYAIHSPAGDTVKGLYVKTGGHLRVIRGYITVNGQNYLLINDPMPPCEGTVYPISYDEYAHGRGNWLQTTTLYNISKN